MRARAARKEEEGTKAAPCGCTVPVCRRPGAGGHLICTARVHLCPVVGGQVQEYGRHQPARSADCMTIAGITYSKLRVNLPAPVHA